MTIIKRSRSDSTSDLIAAINTLIPLLQDQKEDEAAQALKEASELLGKGSPQSDEHHAAVRMIVDAFEGDHELIAYTFHREGSAGQWTEVEQLAEASSRVISLARRMQS
jgi:hypothetical protein